MQFGKGNKDNLDIPTVSNPSSFGLSSSSIGSASSSLGSTQGLDAILGRGSKVVGQLTFSGPVELDGHVEGEISSQDRLTIGESAVLNAKITGSEITVKGTVNGDIIASKKLILKKPAKIRGNIAATNLSMEEGVIFEGKCSMSTSGISAASTASSTSDRKKDGASLPQAVNS